VSTKEALLLALEEVLNRVVGMDPYAVRQLSALHGRVVAIHVEGANLTLYFIADQQGRLQVLGNLGGEPDCRMSGTPLNLMNSALARHKEDALFSGRVTISGDTDLASRFSEILSGLEIDWEEQLSRLTGDVVAHEAGNRMRSFGRWADRTGDISRQNLREYLQEEARLVPTRYEVAQWQNEVDVLRDDSERLVARVARLVRAMARASRDEPGE
jgi:ubiquinone biosynthesis protein UbiJ